LLEYDITANQSTLITLIDKAQMNYAVSFNAIYFVKSGQIYKYLNKNSVVLTLGSILDPFIQNVVSVSSALNNQNTLLVKSSLGLSYIDLEKGFAEVIDPTAGIISIAQNGKALIFSKTDGSLFSYSLEDTTDVKSYLATTSDLKLNSTNINKIYFSQSAKNIIYFTKDNKLNITDIDGSNDQQLLTDFSLKDNDILILTSGTDLYALISEKNDDNTTMNNIFDFSLETK